MWRSQVLHGYPHSSAGAYEHQVKFFSSPHEGTHAKLHYFWFDGLSPSWACYGQVTDLGRGRISPFQSHPHQCCVIEAWHICSQPLPMNKETRLVIRVFFPLPMYTRDRDWSYSNSQLTTWTYLLIFFMFMSMYCCCNHAPNYGTGLYGGLS